MAMFSYPRDRRQFLAAGLFGMVPAAALAQVGSSARAAKLTVADASLKPDRIDPKDIISGSPGAGDLVFSTSADSRETRGVWSCTRGSFHWTFDTDETTIVLEGRVSVRMEDGTTLDLKSGDLAFFPRGQKSVWTIEEDLRKAYVLYR
jgi:uncharacterized cupin superfamily protein